MTIKHKHLGFVPLNVRVLLEVDIGSFEAGDAGDEAEVGDGQVGAGRVLLSLQERVQEVQGILDLGQLVLVGWGTAEQLWVLENEIKGIRKEKLSSL